jgi:hypothetical protein
LALLADGDRGAAIVEGLYSMSTLARERLIRQIAGRDILAHEAINAKLNSIRWALAGPDPSPTEVILAERAAVCWLLLWRYEHAAVEVHAMSIPQADFQQRLINHAHNRLNSALLALARVRRLALPVLAAQINIAQAQQVNNAPS